MSVMLKSLYRISVEVINIDMTKQEAHNNLYSRFQNLNRVIDHLINNSLNTSQNDPIIGFDENRNLNPSHSHDQCHLSSKKILESQFKRYI